MNNLRHTASIVSALVIFCVVLTCQTASAADAFFEALEDLPIMEGLAENQAASVTFETANGRIVEVEASGAVSADAVRKFYAEILPQLGWTRVDDEDYVRDDERLQLTVSDADRGRVIAAFSLSPKPR